MISCSTLQDYSVYRCVYIYMYIFIYLYTNSTGESKVKGLLGTNFEKLMFPFHQGKMKGRFNLTFSSQVTLEVTFTTVQRIITIPERSQSQNCQDVLFFIYSDMPLASKDVNFDKVKSLYMQNLWSSNSTPFNKTLPINPKYESPKTGVG